MGAVQKPIVTNDFAAYVRKRCVFLLIVFLSAALVIAQNSKEPERLIELELMRTLEDNFQRKVHERAAFLNAKIEREADFFKNTTLHDARALALLAPAYPCPYSLVKNPSVEDQYDGGKWVCGLAEIASRRKRGSCVVYSFGSNSNDLFERSIAAVVNNCDIHIFDPTSPPLPQWSYHSYGLSADGGTLLIKGKEYPVKRLDTIIRELKHGWVDILKVDIEGSEWDILEKTQWQGMCIGQILMEVHDFSGTIRLPRLVKLFERLEKAGFRLYSMEPVCKSCVGQFELGFLNVRWDPRNGWRPCATKKMVK